MFKDRETYVKPTADILVIDIDEARMVSLNSDNIGEDDGDPGWDFED